MNRDLQIKVSARRMQGASSPTSFFPPPLAQARRQCVSLGAAYLRLSHLSIVHSYYRVDPRSPDRYNGPLSIAAGFSNRFCSQAPISVAGVSSFQSLDLQAALDSLEVGQWIRSDNTCCMPWRLSIYKRFNICRRMCYCSACTLAFPRRTTEKPQCQ